jgi:hypothetical protein
VGLVWGGGSGACRLGSRHLRLRSSFLIDFHSRSCTTRHALVFTRVFSMCHSPFDHLPIISNNANDVYSNIELIFMLGSERLGREREMERKTFSG